MPGGLARHLLGRETGAARLPRRCDLPTPRCGVLVLDEALRPANFPGGPLTWLTEAIHYLDLGGIQATSLREFGGWWAAGARRARASARQRHVEAGAAQGPRRGMGHFRHSRAGACLAAQVWGLAFTHPCSCLAGPCRRALAGGAPALWAGVTKLYASNCSLESLDGVEALRGVLWLYLDNNRLEQGELLRLLSEPGGVWGTHSGSGGVQARGAACCCRGGGCGCWRVKGCGTGLHAAGRFMVQRCCCVFCCLPACGSHASAPLHCPDSVRLSGARC